MAHMAMSMSLLEVLVTDEAAVKSLERMMEIVSRQEATVRHVLRMWSAIIAIRKDT